LLTSLYFLFVVVTGSSSGIGMNYAKELAKRGVNVVLMSNEEDQLHEVSKEIGKYLILEPMFQDRAALCF